MFNSKDDDAISTFIVLQQKLLLLVFVKPHFFYGVTPFCRQNNSVNALNGITVVQCSHYHNTKLVQQQPFDVQYTGQPVLATTR